MGRWEAEEAAEQGLHVLPGADIPVIFADVFVQQISSQLSLHFRMEIVCFHI